MARVCPEATGLRYQAAAQKAFTTRQSATELGPSGALVTARQIEVLREVDRIRREEGLPPSIRQLGQVLGIASTNGVNDHLRALQRKGLLERRPVVSRGLFVTSAGRELLEQLQAAPAVGGAA